MENEDLKKRILSVVEARTQEMESVQNLSYAFSRKPRSRSPYRRILPICAGKS